MSLRFTSASSQNLLNSSPGVVTFPQTFACWLKPVTVTACTVMELGNTASASHWCGLGLDTTSGWGFEASATGGAGTTVYATTASAGRWDFCMIRWISATNRRISVLTEKGNVAHAQSTTSINPTITNFVLASSYSGGPGFYFNGCMAELWRIAADVQPDGAQTENWFLRKLAYEGPFAFPHLRKDLIEYHAFRSAVITDRPNEALYGLRGAQTYTIGGSSPAIDTHAPLLGSYRTPVQPSMIIPG